MKYVVFLGDGMADRPIASLGNLTPLGAAKHPWMDRLASNGLFGLASTIPAGMTPGSDTANLAVLGYDPKVYYSGRSPLEAASIGVDLRPDDVTYRCNLVTLAGASRVPDTVMLDYSAGEIATEDARALIELLGSRINSDGCHLYSGYSYRHCLVLHHADTGAELTPPHDFTGKPVAGRLPTGKNERLLNEIIRLSYEILSDHPVNRLRVADGKNPANAVWFWGEGRRPALTPFFDLYGLRGAVVSAVDLIQGIGVCAGMTTLRVEGATGNYHTNFAGKGAAAIEALKTGSDLVYIHVEAPDECGHHAQIREKVYSIEQIDRQIIAPVMSYLDSSGEDYAVLLMPDHPTPIELMTHTADPVPFALYRKGDQKPRKLRYDEINAADTGVFVPHAHALMAYLTGQNTAAPYEN